MTSHLRENFESSSLTGYRTVSGGYAAEHTDIRTMRQTGPRAKVPLHFLSRFTMDQLEDAIAPNATPVGQLGVNERRPGDNWVCVLSPGNNVAARNKPGLREDIGFTCSVTGTNDFISAVSRPTFAFPGEPLSYSINTSAYASSDIFYLVIPEIPSQINLSSSWVMVSSDINATTSSTWKMAPLSGTGITKTGSVISFPLSAFSSLPTSIASVRLSFACSSGSSSTKVYVSEIGIRKANTTWRPMDVDTLHDYLNRSGANYSTGELIGPRPTSQPQMIWGDSSNNRIRVLGGTAVAEFNSGHLPALEESAIRFYGDVDIRPKDDENIHEMSSNFSITCWVRLNADSFAATRNLGIAAKWEQTYDPATDTYGTEHGSYRFGVTSSGELRMQLGTSVYTSSGAGLVADTWYHLAATRSSGTLKMYANGSLVSTHSVGNTVTTDNTAPFSLGAWSSY